MNSQHYHHRANQQLPSKPNLSICFFFPQVSRGTGGQKEQYLIDRVIQFHHLLGFHQFLLKGAPHPLPVLSFPRCK